VYLDHVALATRDAGPPLTVLVAELGATVLSGGLAVGYRPMQVHVGDADSGMKVELLEPWRTEENDFLARFVDRHGEGPHHLTFKVDDLEAMLARVDEAGLTAVGIDLSYPVWMEAFLQPKDAHGTVVQLAESSLPSTSPLDDYAYVAEQGTRLMEGEGGEQWWPDTPPRASDRSYLRRIVMATPNLAATTSFFTGLLEGTEQAGGKANGNEWLEVTWAGGGCIRLEARDDRPPGIDRLEVEGPGPARELVVAGARVAVNPVERA
jgi:catechol 2,3-dioxygenase-like lactoylglutathione lyase family enzyme